MVGLLVARGRARAVGGVGVGVWGLVWVVLSVVGAGQIERAASPAREAIRFGVVQTNVAQSTRVAWSTAERLQDASRFLDLSAEAADLGAQVLVWPETMFPGETLEADAALADAGASLGWSLDMQSEEAVRALEGFGWLDGIELRAREDTGVVIVESGVARGVVLRGQRSIGVPIVMGAAGYDGYRVETSEGRLRPVWSARYNSAFVVDGGVVQGGRYDKLHLTPFGETMPYISAWGWLESAFLRIGLGASGMAFDLNAGDRAERLRVSAVGGGQPVVIATPICFEATMPNVVRRLVVERGERAAGLIVQMTNDGWFGWATGGREQHLDAVRWRAVELGTPIVRSANTGVSAFVDARGRVTDRLPAGEAGVLVSEVAAAGGSVPMAARLGDSLAWFTLGVTVILIGLGFVPREHPRQDPARPAA
ncbi:MAG: apolipoprotein N-acyltransferase [Phycisphaerales bacterium]|nr:MAG: apolipoprotein N-acyltransferase [Phycisphaerales bacterium]